MLKIEKLQQPTGKYSIGFRHTSLTDESRQVDGKGIRELPIMIWYPAASVEGCEVKHYQPEKAFQVNYDLHYGLIGTLPWPLNLLFQSMFRKIKFIDILTDMAYIP